MENETYYVKVTCGNCGASSGREVPKGVTISQFLGHECCGACGCASLHESRETFRFFREPKHWLSALKG